MKIVEEYLKHADECRKLASQSEMPEQRRVIQRVAETWKKLAEERLKYLDWQKRRMED